jgi:hypothetical protein
MAIMWEPPKLLRRLSTPAESAWRMLLVRALATGSAVGYDGRSSPDPAGHGTPEPLTDADLSQSAGEGSERAKDPAE